MAKKYTKLFSAVLFALASVGSALLTPVTAAAEGVPPAFIQITPTKQKVSIEPGGSYTSSMKVQNIGEGEFNYTVEAVPYSVVDENYTQNYNNVGTYSRIAEWITFDEKAKSGTLAAGESADVNFTVNVPKDAPAGGQYAAIMASTGDGSSEANNVRTISRVGMIFYASIAGETRKEGSVVSNSIPSIVFEPPLTVTSLVENNGNVEATAEYTFKIWPLFDKETIYNNEDNKGSLDVMPETRRFGTMSWDGAPRLGIFWVEQTVSFLDQVSTNKKLVFICPIWLLFIIFAIIFFMIFWLISRARKRSGKESKVSRKKKGDSEKKEETENE